MASPVTEVFIQHSIISMLKQEQKPPHWKVCWCFYVRSLNCMTSVTRNPDELIPDSSNRRANADKADSKRRTTQSAGVLDLLKVFGGSGLLTLRGAPVLFKHRSAVKQWSRPLLLRHFWPIQTGGVFTASKTCSSVHVATSALF